MAYPAGVQTVQVNWGTGFTAVGEWTSARLTVVPVFEGGTKQAVWAATGDPLLPIIASKAQVVVDPDTPPDIPSITLPAVDQTGWRDDAGNSFKDWFYKATIYYEKDGQSVTIDKLFKVVMGQTVVDLDMIFTGYPGAPSVAPMEVVTSFNGRTGNVSFFLDSNDQLQTLVLQYLSQASAAVDEGTVSGARPAYSAADVTNITRRMILGGNTTMAALPVPTAPWLTRSFSFQLEVKQGSVAAYTLGLPSNVVWDQNVVPVMTTGLGRVMVFIFEWDPFYQVWRGGWKGEFSA